MLADMLQELETWWQNTTPEMQAATREGGLVVAMLLAGHLFGGVVARVLRARNFDAALRMPGYRATGPPTDQQMCRLTDCYEKRVFGQELTPRSLKLA